MRNCLDDFKKSWEDLNKLSNLNENWGKLIGLELSKEFYPTVAVENYQALLYDCLTRLAGGDVATPETTNFTGEFEPAKTTEPEAETEIQKKSEEIKEQESSDTESEASVNDDNEAKVLALIKKMDEGDGIYYDDLGIAISTEGVDGPMLDEILDSLTDQGLIFQPRFNHYKEA